MYIVETKKQVRLEPVYETVIEEFTLAQYIGRVIQNRREELDLNVLDVFKLTMNPNLQITTNTLGKNEGISDTTIGKIEKGITNPNLRTLEILCLVLDLHISDLFPKKEINNILTEENGNS